MSLLRVVVVALATLFLFAGFATAGEDKHPDYPDHDDYPDYDDYPDHDDYLDHDDYDYDGYHHKIRAPKCYDYKWKWTYNSLGQNPCKVAAYLLSTCHGGSYSIPPLPRGKKYEIDCKDDFCECNSVIYSLISACEACQGGRWCHYKEYAHNCTKVLPPGHFPHPVPYGTRVPKWAFLDVTYEDSWDSAKAQAVGDQPEAGPGTNLA